MALLQVPQYYPQNVMSCRVAQTVALPAVYAFKPNSTDSGQGTIIKNSGALAALVIDTLTLNVGDRVVLRLQSDASQNGIWVVIDPGSSTTPWLLQRAPDFADLNTIRLGRFTTTEEGTTLAGHIYVVIAPAPSAINVGSINFHDAG